MIVKALLWVWLHSYSTQVIHGVQQGGQVHIAFGRSASQISRFFAGTSVLKSGNEWSFKILRTQMTSTPVQGTQARGNRVQRSHHRLVQPA